MNEEIEKEVFVNVIRWDQPLCEGIQNRIWVTREEYESKHTDSASEDLTLAPALGKQRPSV